jgi:hypothetical protein
MHRDQIFKLVKSSLWNNPGEWHLDHHKDHKPKIFTTIYWLVNQRLGVKFWTANGLPYFTMSKIESEGLFIMEREKIKLTLLQTTLLHIIYLRKIKKYPYLLILIRYALFGTLSIFFVAPLLVYLENLTNKKEVELNIKKTEQRNIILNQILN